MLREAQRQAPTRSRRLARSGYTATERHSSYKTQARDRYKQPRVRAGQVLVAFAAYYSKFVERGAKRHAIPRERRAAGARGKVLLIPGLGYRRRVAHPGMGKQPFMGPALESVRERAGAALAAEIEAEIERSVAHD